MDRVREKSKFAAVKKVGGFSVLAMLFLYSAISIAGMDFESRRVDRDTLLVDTVQRGTLEIRVSANGELLPRDIELISAQVEGRVARVFVAPGDEVKTGQLLAQLSNPGVVNAAEEAFSAWKGTVADLKVFEVELRNGILNQEVYALQAKFAFKKEILKLEAERILHDKNIVSDIDYQQRELSVEQLKQTVAIEEKRLQQNRNNMDTLLTVKKSRVTQLARALDRANDRVTNLSIVAGIAAVVQQFDLELGQQLILGSPIGKLARQDVLYAELRVPARQAGEVIIGQNAIIDTRNGTVKGKVSRIDPGVSEGTVIVDVELEGRLPKGARLQLQVEGIIYIAQIDEAIFVGKPTFTRTNAEVTIYKLDSDSDYASRVRVMLGRSSVNRVEVLDGLVPGDRVILSDSSDWQDQPRILLN
ncbi:MAG: efflux RND transporter periplasmic adaptor subunit [bacterium]|nr:HlyD family efflux transporter periplasmic adaptor subunit [Gammaproteobacteria bacterium]HIL94543.1 HlyD family efflux transporter periplasmic adaptor subunit [Pseudomonadales bacterium]